ncbi:CD1375 family protein [Paenibacillus illinoisensis]|nr:CD1375 family protein [Paenibacillus illinoisensis]
MVAVYVALIQKGVITIVAVPESSRTKVAEALETARVEQRENIV